MKKFQQYYKFKLWEKLREAGINYSHEYPASLLIKDNGKGVKNTAHVLYSKAVKPFEHQANPDIEVQSVGLFSLETSALLSNPDYYILIFGNDVDVLHFIIIPYAGFINNLEKQNRYPVFDKKLKLQFWLLPGNRLVEVSGISPEGEWFYLSGGGSMAEEIGRDYSRFLERWELLID